MTRWTWRVADREASAGMRLKYEPGGWGDVLKGTWAAEVSRWLHGILGRRVRVADPFAGAPDYPLASAAASRVEAAAGTLYRELQDEALGRRRLLSTASVVRHAATDGVDLMVFDADPARLRAWTALKGVRVLPVSDGWGAMSPLALDRPDLVIVDPYDFDRRERWTGAMTGLAELHAGGSHLLIYLANRGGRSAAGLREYRDLRASLAKAMGGEPAIVGRVPSDALLPRAWHEVMLVEGHGALPPGRELLDRLAHDTEALARGILAPGIVERSRSDPAPAGRLD